jgi:heterotetrameric sarcosine oxidase gamma subunit
VAEHESALKGHYKTGRFGEAGEPGVTLAEVPVVVLHQIAAWPDTMESISARAAQAAGVDSAPGPGGAAAGPRGAVLRVEPLKWWLYGVEAPELDAEEGVVLDLSHSRTQIRVTGPDARECLNRLIPLDLRSGSFPVDSAAATGMNHVGVALWHSRDGFELFLPRGFAVSLWELLLDTAEQFGVEVK